MSEALLVPAFRDAGTQSITMGTAVDGGELKRKALRGASGNSLVQGTHLALSLDMFCSAGTSVKTMAANVAGFTAALVELVAAGGGKLVIPHGHWHFNGPISCDNWSHIVIAGEGWDSSYLCVHGLSGQAFFDCANPDSGQVDYCHIRGVTIYGSGLNAAIAIRQVNWEAGSISARIAGFTGGESVGIELRGRELVSLEVYVTADRPVVIGKNPAFPNSAIGLDHYWFRDCTLYTSGPEGYAVTAVDECDLTLVSWQGCAVISDGGGFDLTKAHDLVGLSWTDVRHESATGAANMTGWGWDISAAHRATSLNWANCRGTHQAWRLRGATHSTLIGCGYEGLPGVALDIDATCDQINTIGFFTSGGSVNYSELTRWGLGPVIGDGGGNYYVPTACYTQT